MFKNPLIIFDCDGVLVDSEVIYLEEEFAVLESRGVHVDRAAYQAEFMALAQPLWEAKFAKLIEDESGTPFTHDDYQEMKKRVRKRVLEELTLVEGTKETLDALDVPICVASSTGMQFLPGKLERTGLTPYFGDGVFSGDMVENGKPAPDLFLYAAEKMAGTPDNAIVIEDSVNGVKGGKAAGMFTIGFTGGFHCHEGHGKGLEDAGADLVVGSHAELSTWFRDNGIGR